LELSGGTSDFEDAYSDYGTTEEEEENNSIPPADLEAILAENAKLWGHQQGQQQQETQMQMQQQQQQQQQQLQQQEELAKERTQII
jgi:transcription initiation factor TFIID subunit TAF12